jgi:hypothetical protein
MLSITATPHASGGLSDRTNHVSNVCPYVLRIGHLTLSPPPSPLRRRRRHRQGKARAARRRLFSSNSQVVRGSSGSILDADDGEGGRTDGGGVFSSPGGGQQEAAVPILWGLAGSRPLDRRSLWRRSWLWLRITRTPRAAILGLAVVVTLFTGGGRPVTVGWWISIRHPVLAASRGDKVVGENRAVWRAMAMVYVVTLLKASLVQRLSNRPWCSRGNP